MSTLTEQEAATKWCPFRRVALSAGLAANWTGNMNPDGKGHGNIYPDTRCLGAGCMAWRSEPVLNYDPGRGRCGLAGPT